MKTKRTMTALALLIGMGLASCTTTPRPQMIRTTVYGGTGLRGAMVPQTVIETPYESPAYQAAGEALFSRP